MLEGAADQTAADDIGAVVYDGDAPDRSLVDDVEALIDDGKTYLQAELAFQKTRAGYVAGSARNIAMLGALAVVFVVLALIGLTVGLILALSPLITAWGATAVVVGVLLLAAFVAVRMAGKRWSRMMVISSGTTPS